MKPEEAKILLVDDDRDICRNLCDILGDMGYSVDTAHDGATALEMARKRAYDLALLDLKMPGMDGLTLTREIRKIRAGTVSLLVTGYASDQTAAEAITAGAWRVFNKPVNIQGLLNVVNEAIEQPFVLIVDDDPDLCANLWDLLRDRGYRVCLAGTLAEAEAELKDRSFSIVLIDMKIPDADGEIVFRRVRAVDPEARSLLITGRPIEAKDQIEAALAEGADAVCYKPFDVPSLLNILEDLMKHRNKKIDVSSSY
jgi:DNA-binding NtrC family response regulator